MLGYMTDTELLDWLEKQEGGALINDDEGHWAFASEGIQNINLSDEEYYDLHTVHWVEKHAFKDSIREAIRHAIDMEGA